ncbi:30S ribosomal protein S2 [bacterium K02(2017)]|nr:30S ribosomal protein S2 [bacterium K02(2017)]
MTEVSIPEMMEAGAHFGHQTKRWNPKMRQYIYGARSGVHIINLQRTKKLANDAFKIVTDTVARGEKILFVGTKPQARDIVKKCAIEAKQHYVNHRWMGGTLTNFNTIKKSIDRLIDLERRRENNDFEGLKKRELLEIDRTINKLEASLGGIKSLSGVPSLVFIIDPNKERIAVLESRKLGIPLMAITDSNCDPELIDHVIPANDDAIRSVEYFAQKLTEACLEGLKQREVVIQENEAKRASQDKSGKATKRSRVTEGVETSDGKDGKPKTAYVGRSANNEYEGESTEGFSAKVEAEAAPKPSVITEDSDAVEETDEKSKTKDIQAAS